MDTTPYEKKDAHADEVAMATPAAQAHADEVGVDVASVEGTGKDGIVTKADVAEAAASAPPEDLNDCGHPGPSFYAASGNETVRHCGKCAGMTGY